MHAHSSARYARPLNDFTYIAICKFSLMPTCAVASAVQTGRGGEEGGIFYVTLAKALCEQCEWEWDTFGLRRELTKRRDGRLLIPPIYARTAVTAHMFLTFVSTPIRMDSGAISRAVLRAMA